MSKTGSNVHPDRIKKQLVFLGQLGGLANGQGIIFVVFKDNVIIQWTLLNTYYQKIDQMAVDTQNAAHKVFNDLNLRQNNKKSGKLSPSLDVKIWNDVVNKLDSTLKNQISKMQEVTKGLTALQASTSIVAD